MKLYLVLILFKHHPFQYLVHRSCALRSDATADRTACITEPKIGCNSQYCNRSHSFRFQSLTHFETCEIRTCQLPKQTFVNRLVDPLFLFGERIGRNGKMCYAICSILWQENMRGAKKLKWNESKLNALGVKVTRWHQNKCHR